MFASVKSWLRSKYLKGLQVQFQVTLHANMTMPDSQRHPQSPYVIKYELYLNVYNFET